MDLTNNKIDHPYERKPDDVFLGGADYGGMRWNFYWGRGRQLLTCVAGVEGHAKEVSYPLEQALRCNEPWIEGVRRVRAFENHEPFLPRPVPPSGVETYLGTTECEGYCFDLYHRGYANSIKEELVVTNGAGSYVVLLREHLPSIIRFHEAFREAQTRHRNRFSYEGTKTGRLTSGHNITNLPKPTAERPRYTICQEGATFLGYYEHDGRHFDLYYRDAVVYWHLVAAWGDHNYSTAQLPNLDVQGLNRLHKEYAALREARDRLNDRLRKESFVEDKTRPDPSPGFTIGEGPSHRTPMSPMEVAKVNDRMRRRVEARANFQEMGVTTAQAQAVKENCLNAYPGLRDWVDIVHAHPPLSSDDIEYTEQMIRNSMGVPAEYLNDRALGAPKKELDFMDTRYQVPLHAWGLTATHPGFVEPVRPAKVVDTFSRRAIVTLRVADAPEARDRLARMRAALKGRLPTTVTVNSHKWVSDAFEDVSRVLGEIKLTLDIGWKRKDGYEVYFVLHDAMRGRHPLALRYALDLEVRAEAPRMEEPWFAILDALNAIAEGA